MDMNEQKILGMSKCCFAAVVGICLIGIVIGSMSDFSINVALANKTGLGAFFATYGSYFSYCLYPAAGACLFWWLYRRAVPAKVPAVAPDAEPEDVKAEEITTLSLLDLDEVNPTVEGTDDGETD